MLKRQNIFLGIRHQIITFQGICRIFFNFIVKFRKISLSEILPRDLNRLDTASEMRRGSPYSVYFLP